MTTYNTGNPIGSTSVKDLYDNAQNLDEFVNSKTALTYPDRLGVSRKTWHGIEVGAQLDLDEAVAQAVEESTAAAELARDGAIAAETAAESARDSAQAAQVGSEDARDDAVAAAGAIGPIVFFDDKADADAGIATIPPGYQALVLNDETRDGARTQYKDVGGVLVFTVNLDQLRLDLRADGGSARVGFDGGTAQDVLDNAKPMQGYTALRAYTGRATGIRITSSGIAGFFQLDASDTTSADNGGTIIVDGSGRRWKRLGVSVWNVQWFGASDSGDATAAIQACADSAGEGATLIFPQTITGYHVTKIRILKGQTWRGFGREKPGIIGIVATNDYPATAYPVRNIHLRDLDIFNTGNNALRLHVCPDSSLDGCSIRATGATAYSQILSARCKVNGNRILTSGDFYAAEFLNNCNGTDAGNNTVSGGAAGGGVVVGRTQTLNLDNTVNEVGGGVGLSVASMRVLGSGFTNGEVVTLTAVDGTGVGATGTATVAHGILTAVAITSGGSGYTTGEEVRIQNAGNTQAWGYATVTVVGGAVTAAVDQNGGNCSGISARGYYWEQVRRPAEIGLVYSVIGIDLTGCYISNAATNVVSARDSAFHIGRVAGLIMPTFYPTGTGTENLFEWYDVTNGAGPLPFLTCSDIRSKNVSGYANNFALNSGFTVPGRQNLIYGTNLIQIKSNTVIGQEREWFSPTIVANAGYGQTQAIEATPGGGIITAIDIIDKSGVVTCTLSIGYSGNINDTVSSVDPNTLTYASGFVRLLNEASNATIRATFGLQMRVTAGAGIGTFRVRIRYRA